MKTLVGRVASLGTDEVSSSHLCHRPDPTPSSWLTSTRIESNSDGIMSVETMTNNPLGDGVVFEHPRAPKTRREKQKRQEYTVRIETSSS
jgi:hypothetical protein